MSDYNKSKPSKAAYGVMKIINHPDKLYGEVTTRQMTDEEKTKYGTAVPNPKIRLGDEEYMKKLKISTEELLEDCKGFGTDWEACALIGAKRGITQKQVSNLIVARGIKKLIALPEEVKPETECTEHKDCEVIQRKGYTEHSLGLPNKGTAIDFSQLDEVEIKSRPKEDYLDALAYANEVKNGADVQINSRLKIEKLSSQNGRYFYILKGKDVQIIGNGNILVKSKDIDEFIKDLQEVKKIVNE